MTPDNPLLFRYKDAVEKRAGALIASEKLRKPLAQVCDLLRQEGLSVKTPGMKHVRIAVGRALANTPVSLPDGKVYSSGNYDECRLGQSPLDSVDAENNPDLSMEFVSRMYVVTNEDSHEPESAVGRRIKKWLDEPAVDSSNLLLQTLTPKDAGNVFDVDSITFVIVQATGGVNYCFEFQPNGRLGQAIPQVGALSEFDDTIAKEGVIDTCPIKAVPVAQVNYEFISTEIESVRSKLNADKEKRQKSSKQSNNELGAVGVIRSIFRTPVFRGKSKQH